MTITRRRIRRRRCRRWHMVEETIVLVEHQQQCRAAPHLRIGSEYIEHACGVVGALCRAGRVRMLTAGGIGDHETHLRQLALQHRHARHAGTVRNRPAGCR
jgi:hypothetical protein